MSRKPDCYGIGPSKTATSWCYDSLREHPEVFVPDDRDMCYFDQHRWKDETWYGEHYDDARPSDVIVEFSATYFDADGVARELSDFNPDAKIFTCLRNPVERAFSHFWHLKGLGMIDDSFESVFEYMDLFHRVVYCGFYDLHLRSYFEEFPRDQIKVLFFSDLKGTPGAFYSELCEFLGIDSEFRPGTIGERRNKASLHNYFARKIWRYLQVLQRQYLKSTVLESPVQSLTSKMEQWSSYRRNGISDDMRRKLNRVYQETYDELPRLIGKSIPDWDTMNRRNLTDDTTSQDSR